MLVDHDPAALATIRENLEVLGSVAARAKVVRAEVFGYLVGSPEVDLVLADPPYEFDEWESILQLLADRTPLLVAETASPWEPAPGWETVKRKRYGGTLVSIVQRVFAPADGRRPETSQEGES